MAFYSTKSAVLFMIFNRPDTTRQVFEVIKAAKPSRLYIAADGPRSHREEESQLCHDSRGIAHLIDWECEVKTLFRETNLGCKEAVAGAITWFFEYEEEGIILEDDCLPNESFFMFCDTMLTRYRYDGRIRHICGCNLQFGAKWGNASYYFSNITNIWGWASWRRVWKDYDIKLSSYESDDVRKQLAKIFTDEFVVESWLEIFKKMKANQIDTWDYQLGFLNFFNNGLSIVPNSNLISNIGFRTGATHTINIESKYSKIPIESIGDIVHPQYFLPEKQADHLSLQEEFGIAAKWKKHNSMRGRIKRLIKKSPANKPF